jgi:hypothetical protein
MQKLRIQGAQGLSTYVLGIEDRESNMINEKQ